MLLDRILIVDDDPVSLEYLGEILRGEGLRVLGASGGKEAFARFEQERPDAVFTDWRMPGMDGLALLEGLRRLEPELPVVIVSAYGEVATVVRAVKAGAEDFLTKPFGPEEVRSVLRRIDERCRLREENRHLRDEARGCGDLDAVYRHSPSLSSLLERARRIAPTKATVLIQGETGTGKELLARYIHEHGDRREGPYIRVNCAALSPSLLESEIFGHERGAFTGAVQRRIGRFELAHRGTILLDEVGEMPVELQAKLLRVLEEEEFERVGGQRTIRTDLRVIATTNRDLAGAAADGSFRRDLYYRLNVVPLELIPLRCRRGDIPPLVTYFLDKYRGEYRSRVRRVSGETMKMFGGYSWPGNIRELRNVIQRIVVLDPGEELLPEHVREWLLGCPSRGDELRRIVGMSLAEVEKEIILRTLEETRQNKTEAARILGLTPRTLFNKLRLYRRERGGGASDPVRSREESPA